MQFCFSVAADVGDTGAEFDRVFLQELRDLKMFVNDREIVEEHRRFLKTIFFVFLDLINCACYVS